ncbi:hypothetical protein [Nocardia sp. NPDC004711]
MPEHQVARATAVIFGGVETASVLGVPTGTFLGDRAAGAPPSARSACSA